MEEVNVADAIIDLDTYSLFNEQKIVLCKNSNFLSSGKMEIDHNIILLEIPYILEGQITYDFIMNLYYSKGGF